MKQWLTAGQHGRNANTKKDFSGMHCFSDCMVMEGVAFYTRYGHVLTVFYDLRFERHKVNNVATM